MWCIEAILLIFSRTFLIFVWNMKIDTTFVRMRSTDHFGNVKMSEEAPCFVEFNVYQLQWTKTVFAE